MLLSCSNVLRGLLPLWPLWGGLLGRFEAGREDFCLQLCFSLLSLGKATSILAAAEVLDELSRPVVVHVCVFVCEYGDFIQLCFIQCFQLPDRSFFLDMREM